MLSIVGRKQLKRERSALRQSRLDLLAELDLLRNEMCDKCRRPVSQEQYNCDCSTAIRIREIGNQLSTLSNKRSEIEMKNRLKEVRKVSTNNNAMEITEEAVNTMREDGLTYTAIAKHFGITATTLATRRQNWELERVRKKHKEGKNLMDPAKTKPVIKADEKKGDEISSSPTSPTIYDEIIGLKATLVEKDEFIQKQWNTIDKLTAECDELVEQNESSRSLQDEIRDERKLLAVLLEREAERIKRLVEVG